ncbi:hypothetical protein L484_008553 [Morus notabilis]|uniref:Uncharacterized protein n=1 Tax=Morus notabilis TaxID=981085 RepID=W9SKY1_9ROSA|nr:hypothetical protein L484_008553 [Morus notabilis]
MTVCCRSPSRIHAGFVESPFIVDLSTSMLAPPETYHEQSSDLCDGDHEPISAMNPVTSMAGTIFLLALPLTTKQPQAL